MKSLSRHPLLSAPSPSSPDSTGTSRHRHGNASENVEGHHACLQATVVDDGRARNQERLSTRQKGL